jgi:hypothetical protein
LQKLNSRSGISSQRNASSNGTAAPGYQPESRSKPFKQRWIAAICPLVVAGVKSLSFQPQRWHSGCNPAFMRKGPQRNSRTFQRRSQAQGLLCGFMVAFATLPGCGGGGASSGPLPPPPPTIAVIVTPSSGNVLLGKTLQLTAAVRGPPARQWNWSVNGAVAGNITSGTISPGGLYTAPLTCPFLPMCGLSPPAPRILQATPVLNSSSPATSSWEFHPPRQAWSLEANKVLPRPSPAPVSPTPPFDGS